MGAIWCFQAQQAVQLSNIELNVGEEAAPIILKETPGPRGVGSMLVTAEPGAGVIVEELPPSPGPSYRYRLFRIIGRTPGNVEVHAQWVGRTATDPDPDVPLTVKVLGPDRADSDLIYRGKHVVWQKSIPGFLGTTPVFFHATSGLSNSQMARMQSQRDAGPVPEALYTLVARLNPLQDSVIKANARDTKTLRDGKESINNTEQGIEFLPVGGNGPVYPQWGTYRVRIEPKAGEPVFGRGGFYLHNSHKCFSHGCIEVGASVDQTTDFFTSLIRHANEGGKTPLTFRVKYAFPEQTTIGNTCPPTPQTSSTAAPTQQSTQTSPTPARQ